MEQKANEWNALEYLCEKKFEDVAYTETTYYMLISNQWRHMRGEIPVHFLKYVFDSVKGLIGSMRQFHDMKDHEHACRAALRYITRVKTVFEMWEMALQWVCHGKTMEDAQYHLDYFADSKETTWATIFECVDIFSAVHKRASEKQEVHKRIYYYALIQQMDDLCEYLKQKPNKVGGKRKTMGVDIFF